MEELQVWGKLILFIILPLNEIGNIGEGYDLARKKSLFRLVLVELEESIEILALKMRRNPFLGKSEKKRKMKDSVTN